MELTAEEVARVRAAYRDAADTAAWEGHAVQKARGERPALLKFIDAWDRLDVEERTAVSSELARMISPDVDPHDLDVGLAAFRAAEAGRGRRGTPTRNPGFNAAVAEAVRVWSDRGRDVTRMNVWRDLGDDREPNNLCALMTRVANFVIPVETGEGEKDKPVAPKVEFARAYIGRVHGGDGRLPELSGIVECPTLRPDGTVLTAEGYDRATGLILDTGGAAFEPVPDEPTREDAVAALAKLKWIIKGFPFVQDADGRSPSRSVALSAMLTAVCRRSLRTAPMHGFTAPAMGTGKSLLTDAVAMLAMGRPATVMNQSGDSDGEEERKRLMSVLMQGDPVVVIDNVDRPLGGARMCSIMTQETWQDRVLGGNDQGHVSTRTLWLANGNNLEFREDMSRRAILCTMDAGVERPAERKFDVDLKVEVPRRRGELVPAALTVLRAFVVAGRPGLDRLTPFGSFEDWSDLVRGALVWAGEPDPCKTLADVAAVDSVREELAALIEAWAAVVDVGRVVTAGELLSLASERAAEGPGRDGLMLALEAACPRRVSPKAIAAHLKRVKGKVVGGRRIVSFSSGNNSLAYRLEEVRR